MLKVDEQGMTALVNKFNRDKQEKEEKKIQREQNQPEQVTSDQENEKDGLALFFKDELNEQAVIRSLIEFGTLAWDDNLTIAEFIFQEVDNDGLEELFDNKLLIRILNDYRVQFNNGENPTEKSFLYHNDQQISQLAVSLLTEKHQISPNWTKVYKGDILNRNDLYKEEVLSCMTYLKLKKIKKLILENQLDLEKENSTEDMIILLQTHQHLKQVEMELMRKTGTVIFR
jgi:DNA primase